MTDFGSLGRVLMIAGALLFLAGGLLWFGGRIPGLGRLPGDITFRHGSTTVWIPIATSIVVSVVLTVILNILLRR